ncbi:D-alanyl-D-alanine carboxypeptidase DacA [Thalassobacillus devorans]|uniref:serine-type D-Ala-D-Ala carboxypeptidase n=1 Tax=Thalassobacillus devorans TaxID=279813 RepID=A0ABQ1PCW6_9BACI|nr:serine hydrolase [Thalassobacillus devorans]NIK29184.1 D-alanyl-D-alanine carboxypeptidase (penicillin-binding protein 5/6) [Thalassobacillus devorans]GGC94752.1 D-alanyl-D-alanine carboxypeptidase DacA [Thalassobacillus devorans]
MKQTFKTSWLVVMAVMITLVGFIQPNTTYAQIDINAESAILVDANSGQVLFDKQSDVALPPASMTKMMTEYLVLEAIENGEISWDTTTQISDYPYSISADDTFSGVGLKQNKDYTVRELYEAMAINSDNATTIALTELIAGSEGEFVKMMNEKAKEMGLKEYQFVNSTGLPNSSLGDNYPEGTQPDDDNLLSARSSALLAYHLVNDYPEALEISSITETEFDDQTIRNWNWMLPDMPGYLSQYGYEGMDGMKTGYTDLAGYCFTGTAERDENRLISVVMKTDSEEARFEETRRLMEYGFQQFERQELYPAGHQKDGESELPVAKGKEKQVGIETGEAVQAMIKNGEEDKYELNFIVNEDKLNDEDKLTAPIEKGEQIGTVELVYNGENSHGNILDGQQDDKSIPLVATEAVEKANWFMLTLGAIGDFFSDIFTSAVDTVKGWF